MKEAKTESYGLVLELNPQYYYLKLLTAVFIMNPVYFFSRTKIIAPRIIATIITVILKTSV